MSRQTRLLSALLFLAACGTAMEGPQPKRRFIVHPAVDSSTALGLLARIRQNAPGIVEAGDSNGTYAAVESIRAWQRDSGWFSDSLLDSLESDADSLWERPDDFIGVLMGRLDQSFDSLVDITYPETPNPHVGAQHRFEGRAGNSGSKVWLVLRAKKRPSRYMVRECAYADKLGRWAIEATVRTRGADKSGDIYSVWAVASRKYTGDRSQGFEPLQELATMDSLPSVEFYAVSKPLIVIRK